MSDLAKAAGSGVVFDLGNGKSVEIRPLTARDLGALELQALHNYKRRYIKTYIDNADLLPDPKQRDKVINETMERAAKMDLDSLPLQPMEIPQPDGTTKTMMIPYTGQWMSGTFEGMLTMFWYSARKAQPGMTFDDATKIIEDAGPNGASLLKAATGLIDELSSPPSGNSSVPSLAEDATAMIETA